jgi:hypothetical protein
MGGLGDIRHAQLGPNDEDDRSRNRLALVGLILSLLFDPFLLGLIFSIAGLVRASRIGVGKAMAWAGILLSVAWLAVAIVYVVPMVTAKTTAAVVQGEKRADPGCQAIQDFLSSPLGTKDLSKEKDAKSFEADLQAMITQIHAAAAKSANPTAKAAIDKLASDFETLLDDVKAQKMPPASLNDAIAADGGAVDKACGNS